MEAGLRPGHSVRWGPSSPQKRGTAVLHPFFGPCLLWANGRMDQDATWYRGRPRTRPECVRWEPQNDLDGNPTPPQKGHSTPTNFRSMSTVAISATAELLLHSSRQSRYTLQWASTFPLETAPSYAGYGLQQIRGSFSPPKFSIQTASGSIQLFLQFSLL